MSVLLDLEPKETQLAQSNENELSEAYGTKKVSGFWVYCRDIPLRLLGSWAVLKIAYLGSMNGKTWPGAMTSRNLRYSSGDLRVSLADKTCYLVSSRGVDRQILLPSATARLPVSSLYIQT